MTTQQTFKRRVRERMARTGERYAQARRVLLEQQAAAPRVDGRAWVSQPEMSDEAIRSNTGRGWDEWCDLIEAFDGHTDGHSAVVEHLMEVHGLTGWWAQGVTVSWERITGQRLPFQQSDGLFASSRTRTVAVDADELRELLLDADGRDHLFGGMPTELRSRPTSKNVRIAMEEGSVEFTLTPKPDGRTAVNVAHTRLPDHTVVPAWQDFWTEWLEALEG
ncbi:hypothetical protein [Euzebya rosea]|uniref:hypothetical protein n=1 Tax=Euzebya rosea TaxID=2052804 RepID=UPI000D3E6543|nr:hypothetical protein [Euzebya rosea]